jgi:exopolyphosphatase/guanosine-5'-triphosphate,3'-diphosphate pyrophosphatase
MMVFEGDNDGGGSGGDGHVVGFIDIGTNSVRLMLVRISARRTYQVINLQREVVRLGEEEFADHLLRAAAIERAVLVCRSFAGLARSHGADEIVAVATSATREARNQNTFVARLRDEAGLDVRVVSGREEARLIYLGVQSRVELGERIAFCLDIGGGSTEVIVGDARRHLFLDSLPLGAVRLAGDPSLPDVSGRVSGDDYLRLQRAVRLASVHAVAAVRGFDIDVAYGTSGTARNVAAVAARVLHDREPQRDETASLADVRKVVRLLRGMSLDERRRVPGLNPDRADIVIAGAVVLETLMTDLGLPAVTALTECGLRDGLLMDYLSRSPHAALVHELTVRERSVLRLVRACGADEAHARHVARLALELFDSSRKAGFHGLGDQERELLDYTALLHDVGTFVSYPDHHVHSAYLIANADLLGFDQREIAVMAATALFHRKAAPAVRFPAYARLDGPDRKTVSALANLLRLAERLDRSHGAVVRHARLVADGRRALTLKLVTNGPAQLELWGLENRRVSMQKAMGRRLTVAVETDPGAGEAAESGATPAAGSGRRALGGAPPAPGEAPAVTARRRPSPDDG